MNELKLSILNVGHGDFLFCKTPFNEHIVIDCGSSDNITPTNFLNSLKVLTIDELQISHPHTDHFDDIIEISKKNIRSFLTPNPNNFKDNVIGWRNS